MKKLIVLTLVAFLAVSAFAMDAYAAKKAKKLAPEVTDEMSQTIDNLTKKVYLSKLAFLSISSARF